MIRKHVMENHVIEMNGFQESEKDNILALSDNGEWFYQGNQSTGSLQVKCSQPWTDEYAEVLTAVLSQVFRR